MQGLTKALSQSHVTICDDVSESTPKVENQQKARKGEVRRGPCHEENPCGRPFTLFSHIKIK